MAVREELDGAKLAPVTELDDMNDDTKARAEMLRKSEAFLRKNLNL